MSTCRGAAPPHEDCPHGDACDWRPGESIAEVDAFFANLAKQQAPYHPPNRAGRRAAARDLRKRGR